MRGLGGERGRWRERGRGRGSDWCLVNVGLVLVVGVVLGARVDRCSPQDLRGARKFTPARRSGEFRASLREGPRSHSLLASVESPTPLKF
jgi:hypothetical protein